MAPFIPGVLIRRIWRDGYHYSKAGIISTDLVPLEASQRALIGAFDRERGGALMDAVDACNRRFGRGAVASAAAGLERERSWSTKFEMRSPGYTTRLDEMPVVAAC